MQKWTALSLAGLIASVIATTSLAGGAVQAPDTSTDGVYYKPRLTMGPFYDTEVDSFGLFDLFVPFTMNPDSILFADLRYKANQGPTWEGNFGAGMRTITSSHNVMWGLYGFYDHRRSKYANYFNQVTVGAEMKTEHWSVTANGYIPVGKTQHFVSALDAATLVPNGAFQNIYYRRGIEKAMPGGDILGGWLVPHTHGLGLYVGGFYYSRTGVKTAAGPILHAEYDIHCEKGNLFSILSAIHLVADYQHDNLRGNTFFGGARFDFMLGHQRQLTGLQSRMQDFVRRDLAIQSGANSKTPMTRLNNPNGSAVTVSQVNTFAGLGVATTLATAPNVIGVTGAITNAAGSTLLDGQTISGGAFPFTGADGHGYSVAVGRGGSVTRTAAGDTLTVGVNNTIENIGLTSTVTGGAAINDNAGAAVGDLLIRRVTATSTGTAATDSAIQLLPVGAGTNNITVENSTISGGEDGIEITAGAAAVVTATVRNNAISGQDRQGIHLGADGAAAQLFVTGVTNNSSASAATANDGEGLFIDALNGGLITSGDIMNNTFSALNVAGGAGMQIRSGAGAESHVLINGSISGNTISSAGTQAALRITAQTSAGSSVIIQGGINNNVLTQSNADATPAGEVMSGIDIRANLAGSTVTINGMHNNTISTAAASDTDVADGGQGDGIRLQASTNNGAGAGGNLTVTGLYGNSITTTGAATSGFGFKYFTGSSINLSVGQGPATCLLAANGGTTSQQWVTSGTLNISPCL